MERIESAEPSPAVSPSDARRRAPAGIGWKVGVATTAGLAALYVVSHIVAGGGEWLQDRSVSPSLRFDSLLILLIGYSLGVARVQAGSGSHDLRLLRPVLACEPAHYQALLRRAGSMPRLRLLAACVGGAGVGIAIVMAARGFTGRAAGLGSLDVAWELILNGGLFAILAVIAARTLARAQMLSQIAWEFVHVDLFDATPLAPFGRFGLRMAAFWFLGSSIASLLFLDAASPWLIAGPLIATVGVGVAALVLPSRGIHRKIRAIKRRELERVRRELAAALRSDPQGRFEGVERLAALIAYERRVEAAREWPFDTPTLARFLLFLLLPLGSWLGGAIVERLLEAVLR